MRWPQKRKAQRRLLPNSRRIHDFSGFAAETSVEKSAKEPASSGDFVFSME
jgi:hypothetical protein